MKKCREKRKGGRKVEEKGKMNGNRRKSGEKKQYCDLRVVSV